MAASTTHAAEEYPGSAATAGLRYVSDDETGITRRRNGKGWSYYEPDGTLIRDRETRARINSLAIPPAWTDVWVCPDAEGHLQATGRDDRGRKQYRYHDRWSEVRGTTKFDRMLSFGEALPAIREGVAAALRKRSMARETVLATMLRLLETTCIRIGNPAYARDNGSYGLTTLRDRHVAIRGSRIEFRFDGKGGKEVDVIIRDRRLARLVRECQEIPGYELFQYLDEAGERRGVRSEDVNAYIRELSGEDFTAKDYRTWMGTVHAFRHLCESGPAENAAEAKQNCLAAIDHVAEQLGNTRAVSRGSYIHPGVLESYVDGQHRKLFRVGPDDTTKLFMSPEEVALLRLLRAIQP